MILLSEEWYVKNSVLRFYGNPHKKMSYMVHTCFLSPKTNIMSQNIWVKTSNTKVELLEERNLTFTSSLGEAKCQHLDDAVHDMNL